MITDSPPRTANPESRGVYKRRAIRAHLLRVQLTNFAIFLNTIRSKTRL